MGSWNLSRWYLGSSGRVACGVQDISEHPETSGKIWAVNINARYIAKRDLGYQYEVKQPVLLNYLHNGLYLMWVWVPHGILGVAHQAYTQAASSFVLFDHLGNNSLAIVWGLNPLWGFFHTFVVETAVALALSCCNSCWQQLHFGFSATTETNSSLIHVDSFAKGHN